MESLNNVNLQENNSVGLRKLQLFETEMLKDFDEICMKYDVKYFAIFGTAIGAIRHRGFIPWDDDIDLGIMLEDCKKLMRIPAFEWQERGLKLVTANDDFPSHLTVILRIYKIGTILESRNRLKYDKPRGFPNHPKRPIWIDIFIYNHIDYPEQAKELSRRMKIYQKLYWYAKAGMRKYRTDPISVQITCLRNDFMHKILSLFKEPEKRIYGIFLKKIEDLDSTGGNYITSFESEIIDEMIKSVFKEEDMFPLIRVPFENIEIYIQKNYNEMLSAIYGDYMQLPPVEKRVNHDPAILDFGDGKGNVMKGV